LGHTDVGPSAASDYWAVARLNTIVAFVVVGIRDIAGKHHRLMNSLGERSGRSCTVNRSARSISDDGLVVLRDGDHLRGNRG
jgi:acid phosphatase family membrane protein YuiD